MLAAGRYSRDVLPSLHVQDALPAADAALTKSNAVLVAPPSASKTTKRHAGGNGVDVGVGD